MYPRRCGIPTFTFFLSICSVAALAQTVPAVLPPPKPLPDFTQPEPVVRMTHLTCSTWLKRWPLNLPLPMPTMVLDSPEYTDSLDKLDICTSFPLTTSEWHRAYNARTILANVFQEKATEKVEALSSGHPEQRKCEAIDPQPANATTEQCSQEKAQLASAYDSLSGKCSNLVNAYNATAAQYNQLLFAYQRVYMQAARQPNIAQMLWQWGMRPAPQ